MFGYWVLGIGYWTPCGLLGMGRFAIGDGRWAMGRPAGYWVWDAPLLDALRAMGYWRPIAHRLIALSLSLRRLPSPC